MNIDEMEAGPELDALIAEKVMGWRNCDIKEQCDWWHTGYNKWITIKFGMGEPPESKPGYRLRALIPPYSISVAAAWAVIEYMWKRMGEGVTLETVGTSETESGVGWRCVFGYQVAEMDWWEAVAETMPHAVCLAALKAMEKEPCGFSKD